MTQAIEEIDPQLAKIEAERIEAQAERDAMMAEVQAQIEACDPGELADDENKRILYRFVRLTKSLEDERRRVKEATDAMLKRLDARLDGVRFVMMRSAEDATQQLLAASGGKVKSVVTPWGKAGFRAQPVGVEVVDEAQVPAQFRKVKTEEVIDRAGLRDHFKATGDVPAGCDVKGGGSVFYVGK